MKTENAASTVFATVTGGILLAGALGLPPHIAPAAEPEAIAKEYASTDQQSERIARFFEEVNQLKSPLKEKLWGDDGLNRRMEECTGLLKKNPALINDRMFWAWEPLTRHWHSDIKNMAFGQLPIFNGAKQEYARHILQNQAREWALSDNRHIRWGAKNAIYTVAIRYATGVIGAIGAAHEAFREEAVELVKGVAMNIKEDGTVRDVAFDELAAIGAADQKYAEKLFAWAKEQSTKLDRYNKHEVGNMLGKIGLKNCDRLEEARGILREHFGITFKIEEKYGSDNADGCRVRLEENRQESNLPLGGLIFTADDYSFQ